MSRLRVLICRVDDEDLLKSQWEEVDKLLVEQYQERFFPSGGDV